MDPLAALEFASPAMLGWLAAAALPWLINFWVRRRHNETPWAAVQLLMTAVRERSRRIRLREMLLMAVRMAILLLAAFAAARPSWRAASSAGQEAVRTHHVIVIDCSYSMSATFGGGRRIDQAKARARELVETAPAGDAFTVIAWSDKADNVLGQAAFDPGSALAAIDSIEFAETAADVKPMMGAIEAAIASNAKGVPQLRHTRCIFLTDLGANTWSRVLRGVGREESAWTALAARANVSIEAIDVGLRENVAVTGLAIEPARPSPEGIAAVSVTIQAFGGSAATNTGLELLLDGATVSRREIQLAGATPAVVHFELPPSTVGHHVIEARLAAADVLPIDNRRWLSFEVHPAPRALCIAETDGAAVDIARALNPHFRRMPGESTLADAIHVEIGPPAMLAATDLSRFDAVAVVNVRSLLPREQRVLERYVASGGAGIIILGARSDSAAYSRLLNANPPGGSAAGDGTTASALRIADEPVTGEFRFDPLKYRHPVLAPFAGRQRAGLLGVRVNRYFPVEFSGRKFTRVLDYSSGDPAILVADRGAGRIALVTTDPALHGGGEPWSTLAISPSFVPLVRELFSYVGVARRGETLNRVVGESLDLPGSLRDRPATNIRWEDPTGVVAQDLLEARQSGVYTIVSPGEPDIPVAVNLDPRESDLSAVVASDVLPPVGAAGRTESGLIAIDGSGIALHEYALALAIALLVIELALAWLFGRGWV